MRSKLLAMAVLALLAGLFTMAPVAAQEPEPEPEPEAEAEAEAEAEVDAADATDGAVDDAAADSEAADAAPTDGVATGAGGTAEDGNGLTGPLLVVVALGLAVGAGLVYNKRRADA